MVAAGVHEDADPADTMARFPGATWFRVFVTGKRKDKSLSPTLSEAQLVALVLAKVQPALKAGGRVLVSLKVRPGEVAKGLWDDKLEALGEALLSLDVVVIFWHEPENNFTARVFAPAFARARKALKARNPSLVVAYCAMAYRWRPGAMSDAEMQAWASIEADLYLVDLYGGESFDAAVIIPEHPGWIPWFAHVIAKHPGRRWGVGERGIKAGPTRPVALDREAEWLATDPVGETCELVVYWATGGTEDNPGWLLNDKQSVAAVAEYIARITQPRKYGPGPVDGVLVHLATGALVAADLTDQWDEFVAQAPSGT